MAESEHQQNAAEAIDRISMLPDSVLCHILSFIPTRTAIVTCTLSRRWRHIWEHLQVFDFDDNSFYAGDSTEGAKRFTVFVNRVLALRRARDIRKFSLTCGLTDSDSITTWVRAAIGPHLHELYLNLYPDDAFTIPPRVFTRCTALVSLTLIGGIIVEEPSSVRFSSLKTLHLNIDSYDSINTVLSGCPALESLHLFFNTAWSAASIRMPPSLKSLTFADLTNTEIDDLEIDTPSLEYLDIKLKTRCYGFSVGNLQNVVEAHLDIHPVDEHIDFVLKLLRALSRTEFMVLRPSIMKCLLQAPVLDFPEFSYLRDLELTLQCFNSCFLVNLFQKCHVLQVLNIWKNVKEASPLQSWIQPTSVPNCLASHLKVIKFRGYQGLADELAFAAYILRRGLVLETMTIHTYFWMDLKEKHHILKELTLIPRGSNMCQLNFV